MPAFATRPNYVLWSFIAAPFAAFAVYIACLIVPIIVSDGVPAVVQAVKASSAEPNSLPAR